MNVYVLDTVYCEDNMEIQVYQESYVLPEKSFHLTVSFANKDVAGIQYQAKRTGEEEFTDAYFADRHRESLSKTQSGFQGISGKFSGLHHILTLTNRDLLTLAWNITVMAPPCEPYTKEFTPAFWDSGRYF